MGTAAPLTGRPANTLNVKSEFEVPPEFDGQRLDRFLVSVLAAHSRSQIQKLIADGQWIVPRREARPTLSVHEGDLVAVTIPEAAASDLVSEPLPLDIVY